MYLNTRTRSSRGRHLPAGRALAATGLAVTAALALAGCSGGSADVDPEAADG